MADLYEIESRIVVFNGSEELSGVPPISGEGIK